MDVKRETRMCVGGPLHGKRVSVSEGVEWLTFTNGADCLESTLASDSDGAVVLDETEGIVTISTSSQPCVSSDSAIVYRRRSFVTGEKGVIEVFSIQSP